MELIPAIDLTAGRVVRLSEGDFGRATVYGDDPIALARRWADAGADQLHLVDLDGVRAGRAVQARLIGRIVAAVSPVRCQVAGGLRTEDAVAVALGAGADRAVLGTALLADPALAQRLTTRFGASRIVAALDVRDGRAVGEGWRDGAPGSPVLDALGASRSAGIVAFAVTAIARDGLLAGPDLALYRELRAAMQGTSLIASGGIASIADLHDLAEVGADAAILGRALYEGRIDLTDAIAALR